jgi:thioesterase domain-containing protein
VSYPFQERLRAENEAIRRLSMQLKNANDSAFANEEAARIAAENAEALQQQLRDSDSLIQTLEVPQTKHVMSMKTWNIELTRDFRVRPNAPPAVLES